jgi:cytochrome c oxidase cbb3-type subunit 3
MVAWKQSLKPLEMAQVSSYVLQFQGTTPANPKAAEGDVWVDDSVKDDTSAEAPSEVETATED